MLRALWSASSGMLAQQISLDNISNNIANVNTTGYKKIRTDFHDLLYSEMNQEGQVGSNPIQLGNGVRTAATLMLFKQGNLEVTGNDTDLAISGDAFFEILLPDGSAAYTRDGAFLIDQDGHLVTSTGGLVNFTDTNDDIRFSNGSSQIDIDPAGVIFEKQDVIQLDGYSFSSPSGLKQFADGVFLPTPETGQPELLSQTVTNGEKTRAYFRVLLPDGQTGYTSERMFRVDANGRLVTTAQGYPLDTAAQVDPTLFPTGDIVTADEQGTVTKSVEIGKVNMVRFANPSGLERIGNYLYRPTANSGVAQQAKDYRVNKGALESSNVELAEEMTEMIIVQRAYELNSRSLKTSDEMLGIANSLFRR